MRIAVYHNLPSGGGLRLLEAYVAHAAERHEVELFLPATADDDFVRLSALAHRVHHLPVALRNGRFSAYWTARAARSLGRRAARAIDHGDFDAVLTNGSRLTQGPEIMPFLRTRGLYYCHEHLRRAYEQRLEPRAPTLRGRTLEAIHLPVERWEKAFDRKAVRSADHVVTHSRFTQDQLRRTYGIEADVVYLGVDTDRYRPLGLPRARQVVSVGALQVAKGHGFVIDALATISPERRPRLVVIGDRGDDGPGLRARARAVGVELDVRVNVAVDDLVRAYNESSLLACGQVREPFGLITLEAMACATPVVAVAEGGFLESLEDGVTGVLVRREATAFGAAVAGLLDDEARARRMGEAGRADVLARWRWSRTVDELDGMLSRMTREDTVTPAPHAG